MKPEIGQIVKAKTWDGLDHLAVVLERRGSGWIVLPLTSRCVTAGGQTVPMDDWEGVGLWGKAWYWHSLHRVSVDGVRLPPNGTIFATTAVANQIVDLFGEHLSERAASVLLATSKEREGRAA